MKETHIPIDKLPRSDQQDFRSKVLHLSKSFIDKFGMHKNSINQKKKKVGRFLGQLLLGCVSLWFLVIIYEFDVGH